MNALSERKTIAWTDEDKHKFVEAIRLYDKDWDNIANYIGAKTRK